MGEIASEVGFVHLRVHSAYSLLEGALPIKVLAKLAAADRQPALGIADTGNLFGALEFAEKMAEKGIQPIIGCQLALEFGDGAEHGSNGGSRQRHLFDVVLIAATEAGYWNLVRLVSDSYMSTEGDVRAHLALPVLSGRTDG
jgi:DNA polymerase-3 subunit alpha